MIQSCSTEGSSMPARENLTRHHPRTEDLVAHHWEVLCRASTDLYNACSRHQTELVDRR